MKKQIIVPSLLIPAVLMLCAGCAEREKVRESGSPALVKVIRAETREYSASSGYVGRVEPSKSTIVLSQHSGDVVETEAVTGRKVAKGDVLAVLESETVRSAYDIARSSLEQAEDGYERVRKLYANGSVPEVKMVEMRTALDRAKAAEKAAGQALEACTVKAPFSGVIGEVYCHKGEHVAAASPIAQILDVESVEVHFSVPENEYAQIPAGTRAEVEVPALDRVVNGTVGVKGISASPLSHTYDFTLKNISDTRSLMPGMVCKVRVEKDCGRMMVIPASAVMTDMEGRYVWTVGEGDLVGKKYVTVSGYAEKGIAVSEGIAEGERIIVEGKGKVSTGMKVKVQE